MSSVATYAVKRVRAGERLGIQLLPEGLHAHVEGLEVPPAFEGQRSHLLARGFGIAPKTLGVVGVQLSLPVQPGGLEPKRLCDKQTEAVVDFRWFNCSPEQIQRGFKDPPRNGEGSPGFPSFQEIARRIDVFLSFRKQVLRRPQSQLGGLRRPAGMASYGAQAVFQQVRYFIV